ncbi:MAG TPA: NAD-dependent epimerase/dehydratase family protein [bacterium]|jgi:nucleoside-diphosphate-sugar epimerase|nr:NAD-dependent epimerase/dehydratase family protein [bacterium]HPG45814.1 NAD-dependent epimerase/dehydratase family protein [bacterium]HPM97959.1 NAD-dependent epimerase/dehydratase family protein [bacterium]
MKALVTGASGFTGGYMVKNLLQHGYQVRALVRSTSRIDHLKDLPIDWVYGKLESADDLLRAAEGVDVIYHIAALYRAANVPDSIYEQVNVGGTRHVLEAARAQGVKRVIHCSTGGVHGHVQNPPGDEDSPFHPGDIYQSSKLAGEQLAMDYHREHGLPVTVVRPIGIYGPGDTRMLKMYRLIKKGRFVMFAGGRALYHLTFVADTVEGFRLAGESEKAVGQAYLIAGEEYVTLSEFAALIAEVLGVGKPWLKLPVWPLYGAAWLCEGICVPLRIQPPIYRRRVDIFVKDRAFSIEKAKRDLGYYPQVGLREGITRTAAWYTGEGLL